MPIGRHAGAEADTVKLENIRELFDTRGKLSYLFLAMPIIYMACMNKVLSEHLVEVKGLTGVGGAALLLVFSAAYFFGKAQKDADCPPAVCWAIVAAMAAAPIAMYFEPPISGIAVVSAVTLIGGAGFKWFYLQAAQLFCRLDNRRMTGYLFSALALGYACRIVIEAIPALAAPWIAAAIPVLGLLMRNKAFELREKPYEDDKPASSLLPLVALLLVFGVVVGFFRVHGISYEYSTVPMIVEDLFCIVLTLSLAWWTSSRRLPADTNLISQILLVGIITTLFVTATFGSTSPYFTAAIGGCASDSIQISLWLILLLMCRRSGMHPYVVFGFFWGLHALTVVLGIYLGSILIADAFPFSLALDLTYVVLVCTMIVMMVQKRRDDAYYGSAENVPAYSDVLDTNARCNEVGLEYGLTKREVEVMALLCRGYSKKSIADSLVISENTVRQHSKHVYTKLGIHNRDELLAIVQGIASRN